MPPDAPSLRPMRTAQKDELYFHAGAVSASARLPQTAARRKRVAAVQGTGRRPEAPSTVFSPRLSGDTVMAMVCPQCAGSYEQRLQCPTCGVRLLYDFHGPKAQAAAAGRPLAADGLGPHRHRPGAGPGAVFRSANAAPGPARSAGQSGPRQVDLDQRVRIGVFAGPASHRPDGRRHAGRRRSAARRDARRPGRRLERRAVRAAGPALAPEFRAGHDHC